MTGDRFDELLEEVLGDSGRVEPRAGMERRVMARVEAEGVSSAWDPRAMGWWFPVGVTGVLGVALLSGAGRLVLREKGAMPKREATPVSVGMRRGVEVQTEVGRVEPLRTKVRRGRGGSRDGPGNSVAWGAERVAIPPLVIEDLSLEPLSVE